MCGAGRLHCYTSATLGKYSSSKCQDKIISRSDDTIFHVIYKLIKSLFFTSGDKQKAHDNLASRTAGIIPRDRASFPINFRFSPLQSTDVGQGGRPSFSPSPQGSKNSDRHLNFEQEVEEGLPASSQALPSQTKEKDKFGGHFYVIYSILAGSGRVSEESLLEARNEFAEAQKNLDINGREVEVLDHLKKLVAIFDREKCQLVFEGESFDFTRVLSHIDELKGCLEHWTTSRPQLIE